MLYLLGLYLMGGLSMFLTVCAQAPDMVTKMSYIRLIRGLIAILVWPLVLIAIYLESKEQ